MFQIPDVGIEAAEDQVQGEAVAAPSMFPLPVVMLIFLVVGYFMLRTVWKE